jgi:hypothetical protein
MERTLRWEADSHSRSQEIPCFVWNTYVYYGANKGAIDPFPEPDESGPLTDTSFN